MLIGQIAAFLSWAQRAQFYHVLPHIGGMPHEDGRETAGRCHLSTSELRELASHDDKNISASPGPIRTLRLTLLYHLRNENFGDTAKKREC